MLCGHKKTAKCSRRLCPPRETGCETRPPDFAGGRINVAHCGFRVKHRQTSPKQPQLPRVHAMHPLISVVPAQKLHQLIKTNAP